MFDKNRERRRFHPGFSPDNDDEKGGVQVEKTPVPMEPDQVSQVHRRFSHILSGIPGISLFELFTLMDDESPRR